MASIRKEIFIAAPAEDVWDIICDVGAVHTRFVPGFVTGTTLEPGARIVTFETGVVAREVFVDRDDEARRFVYSVVGGNMSHHNASMQVFPEDRDRCRLVWIADLLPDDARGRIEAMMEHGIGIAKKTLDRRGAAT